MLGHRFAKYIPVKDDRTPFEQLLPLFLELLTHTSGDVEEALDWMKELDKEQGFFTKDYTLEDFKADLRKHGLIGDRPTKGGKTPSDGQGRKAHPRARAGAGLRQVEEDRTREPRPAPHGTGRRGHQSIGALTGTATVSSRWP